MCLLVKVTEAKCFSHSLTLQGESVVECAEFLITTLLTFPLFGILIFFFKGLQFKFWYNLNLYVLDFMRKCICKCCDVAMNTGCYFLCYFVYICSTNTPQLFNLCHTTLLFIPQTLFSSSSDLLTYFSKMLFKSWATEFQCENVMSLCVLLQPKCILNYTPSSSLFTIPHIYVLLILTFLCLWPLSEGCLQKKKSSQERKEVNKCSTQWMFWPLLVWTASIIAVHDSHRLEHLPQFPRLSLSLSFTD